MKGTYSMIIFNRIFHLLLIDTNLLSFELNQFYL